jgi:preprotein translocase subunit YajC
MSIAEKIIDAVLIAVVVVCGAMYWAAISKTRKQAAEIAELKTSLTECGRLRAAADAAIERQNAAIEEVRVDTVFINRESRRIVTRYATIRDTIIKNMERDSSCENQIDNIADVMRRFHGVR